MLHCALCVYCNVMLGACEKLLPSGKLGVGMTELPFTFDLVSGTGHALMETYHGVNVSVTYTLRWLYHQEPHYLILTIVILNQGRTQKKPFATKHFKKWGGDAYNKTFFHFNSVPRFTLSLRAIRLQVILEKDMTSWYLGKIIRHNPTSQTFLQQGILSENYIFSVDVYDDLCI